MKMSFKEFNEAEMVYAKNVTGQTFKDKGGVEYTVMSIQPDANYGVSLNLVPKGGVSTSIVHGWDNFAKNFFPVNKEAQYKTAFLKKEGVKESVNEAKCTCEQKNGKHMENCCMYKKEGMEHIDKAAAHGILGSIAKKFKSATEFKNAIDKDPKYKEIHSKTQGANLDDIYKKAHKSVNEEIMVHITSKAEAEAMLRAHGIEWAEVQDGPDKCYWYDKSHRIVAGWHKAYGTLRDGHDMPVTAMMGANWGYAK